MTGRGGIQAFWQGTIDSGVRAVALQTDDLVVAGGLAREIGTVTFAIQPGGGAEQTTAKFVVVWRWQDSDWRWHTDIWNTDA